jgi:hypothetical protein
MSVSGAMVLGFWARWHCRQTWEAGMAYAVVQCGGFTLMHKEDLKRMAPLWLKYSEDVRFDPDVSLPSSQPCSATGSHR